MNRGVVKNLFGSDRLDYPAMCRDVFILGADSQRQSVQACWPSGVAHDGPLGEPQFDTALGAWSGASTCGRSRHGAPLLTVVSPGLIARQQHDVRTDAVRRRTTPAVILTTSRLPRPLPLPCRKEKSTSKPAAILGGSRRASPIRTVNLSPRPAAHISRTGAGCRHSPVVARRAYMGRSNLTAIMLRQQTGEATGTATQLGRFTLLYSWTINVITGVGTGGAYDFTAANGDMLFTSATGLGIPTSTPGVNFIVETHTITGGTGRFAGATGSFTVHRLIDNKTYPLPTSASFNGTISWPRRGPRMN